MSASYCIVKEQQELRKNLRDRLSQELRKLWPHLRIQLQQSSLRKNKILTQLGHWTLVFAWGTFCHRVSGSHSTTCMKSGRHSGPEETMTSWPAWPFRHAQNCMLSLHTPKFRWGCTSNHPDLRLRWQICQNLLLASSFCCQQCQQCTFGHQKKITCSLNHRIAIVPYRTFVLRRRNGRSLAVIPRPKTKTQKHRKLIIHIGFRTLHAAVGWSRASLEISQPCPIGNIPPPNALQSSAGDASSMDVLLGPICSFQPWNSSSCDRILASRSHSAISSWSEGQNGSNKVDLKYLPSILPLDCLEREKAKTRNHATMQGILC